jgi:hypothetical protein
MAQRQAMVSDFRLMINGAGLKFAHIARSTTLCEDRGSRKIQLQVGGNGNGNDTP